MATCKSLPKGRLNGQTGKDRDVGRGVVSPMHRDARMVQSFASRLVPIAICVAVAACSGSSGRSADVSSGPSPVESSPAPSPTPSPAPSPSGCSATVTGLPPSVPADAAQYPFSIGVASSCEWRAQSDALWATVSPGSGRGNATLNLKVEQNTRPDDSRTATITVNDVPFRVLQNKFICSYTLDRTILDEGPGGGNARISLTTRDSCPWTATSSERWLRVVTPGGTGSATVVVDLDFNSSSVERRGVLTIAGQRVEVIQRRNDL